MIENLGDRAVRFARPAGPSVQAIVREVRTWPGVVDVVVTADDIALYFAATPTIDPARIAALPSLVGEDAPGREHVLPVVYDGPDLDAVASATGLSRDEVIAIHSAATYAVATMGFAPGFAYLDGLDPRLVLQRRATPRERVDAGSVAIAGAQTAVYPFASAGGWHLLGRVVGVRMFDERGPLLAPGDRVRFQP